MGCNSSKASAEAAAPDAPRPAADSPDESSRDVTFTIAPDFELGAEVLFQKVPDDPDAPWYKGMYLGESQDPNLPEHLVIDPGDGEPVEELPRAQVKAEAHVTGVQVGQYIPVSYTHLTLPTILLV